MRIDAEVVRLTPEQERERVEKLNKAMAVREERLRMVRFQKFLVLHEEFGHLPPDELQKLHDQADLIKQANKGKELIGGFLNVKWAAQKASEMIDFLRRQLGWGKAKKFALHSGLAAMLVLGGTLSAECIDIHGNVTWTDVLNVNGVTTEGLNHILDTEFHAGTQVTTWYMGLIQGSSTPTLAAADTMSSHAGWTEYTAYSQTNRVTWDEGAASSASMTNSTTMDFSMNASGTVAGGFLTSSSTKSGSSGVLWMTATFSGGNQAVSNGDTLKLTYTLNATAS